MARTVLKEVDWQERKFLGKIDQFAEQRRSMLKSYRKQESATNLSNAAAQAVKSVVMCAVVISMPQLGYAADTTINTAKTTTQGPIVPELNGGDSLTLTSTGSISTTSNSTNGIEATGASNAITNNGAINTSGGSSIGINATGNSNLIYNYSNINTTGAKTSALGPGGMYAQGSQNSLYNTGNITTIGDLGYGINLDGSSNSASNSGTIITSGFNAIGINALGNNNILSNSGSIITTGNDAWGLAAAGNGDTLTNSGIISTSGNGSWAIVAVGSNNLFKNSGTISTTGYNAHGIYTNGSSNIIKNSGSISTMGESAHGIYAVGGSNMITNSGTIATSGANAFGIYASGNSNTITNSGSIISKDSYAIYLDGSGNTFNSLNNFIGGGIYMGTSGTVSFTTGANYSKLYTFEGTDLTINGSGPVPVFINNTTQQAGTYDPTIFASSSDALADMTSAISSLTPGRFNGTDKEHPVWARGFGTTSSYSGSYSSADTTLDRNYIFSGVALGIDAVRSKDLVFGFLGGYGQTSLTADAETNQSFNNTSDGGFLGLYGQKRWKSWAFDFALNGGVQSFQQQRYVNNNLAYLGNSSTQASFQGWWIAPELAATVKLAEVKGWSLLPTARLRYAQQWMGGYTETGGGAANASVGGRNVTIGQSFVGIGTRKTIKTRLGKNTKMVLDGQVGYMYRGAVGDDSVDVTMIGQSLSLPTEISSRNAVAVSAGVALDLSSADTLKIRGDAAAGGGMNYVGGGWAGLSFKF